jgi:tetratricopeptide (TPR) repeat protein
LSGFCLVEKYKIYIMDINGLIQLASQYHQQENFQQAEIIYKEILRLNPSDFHILNYLGNVIQDLHRYDEATSCYQKAIQIQQSYAGSYFNLGSVFEELGQTDKAIYYYQEAIKYDPQFVGSYNNLGNVYRKIGQEDKAIPYFEKAIGVNPNFWGSYYNLGEVFQNKGQIDEAISLFQKALQLNPKHIASLNNLGNCLKEKGLFNEAIICCQTAIQIQPDYAEPRFNRSLLLLLLGNYVEGLKEYEWRWKIKDSFSYQRKFSQPLWQRTDIRGLTILLHAEQGLGDVIQFIRYAPYVAQLGAKVIVECHKELKSLLKNVEGIQQVISQGEELLPFDVHCPIASLPLIFKTNPKNIPAKIPYIQLDSILVKTWQNKLRSDHSKLNIGFVWAGNPKHNNDRNHSIPFSYFLALEKFTDITFYSLQKGKASEQSKNLSVGIKFVDLTEELNDFSDTAALIENLDLVITVDTSVAHLTGALGKPVWTLLPFAPDWRWMLDREDSPWYPTMRLFRQPAPGDWKSVMEKVSEELQKLVL